MLTRGLKPKAHLWTAEITSLVESAGIKMTNRVGHAYLNRLLHRTDADSLKMKTMSEMCDRHGNEVLDYQKQHFREILEEYHFDSDSGKPMPPAHLDALQESASNGSTLSSDSKAKIEEYISSYNERKQDGISI